MTRTLVLTNLYPPHALGGYEWSCHDVMARLVARGHEVEVLTTTSRFAGMAGPEVLDAPVHRELEWYWDDHELVSPPVPQRFRLERRNLARLRAHLARFRPEVISVWNVGGMSHALLRAVAATGTPMVYAVCDEWPVYGPHLDAWGRLFLDRPRLGAAVERLSGIPSSATDLGPTGAWCFVSAHTEAACRAGSRFSFPRHAVVHSGIDTVDFSVVDRPASETFGWRLLYVGRFDERKGVLTAIEALADLPEATLRFVGRGDAEAAMRAQAEALGVADRIELGEAPRAELAAIYRDHDAFLFTSEWDEPFGLTPIEAMACGVPVIGTATGGSAGFLLDGRTALRYRPGDADDLVAAVRRLARDPALRKRLVEGGRSVATELTTDRLADTFEAWHDAAAAGFRDGEPAERSLLGATEAG